ncbi:MAG: biotin--[acetyl-CoA-carboxylase] ligase [Desulfotignum sp.]|nr:biotin--[acetyl-CoA-carboxylase] ligase [Desulfotignum sp.]
MVNQTPHIRQLILERLYTEKKRPVSGVRLSELTGISRVAIWKHIHALKKDGLPIESSPKGYFLSDHENLILPACFDPSLADRIHYFPQVTTTMDKARELARKGAPHLSCVVAEHQTKGRGRLNRKWTSDPGGLWITLILTPDAPPGLAYLYNFAASLSLSLTLDALFGLNARVKWPNDLLLEGKKLAGLLSEIETRADMIRYLLVGIGINVNNDPSSPSFEAISISQALGRPVSRKEILTQFIQQFSDRIRHLDTAGIMAAWKQRTSTIGTRVRVETRQQIIEGLAADVDEAGTLWVKDADHQMHKIIYGDCFHA